MRSRDASHFLLGGEAGTVSAEKTKSAAFRITVSDYVRLLT